MKNKKGQFIVFEGIDGSGKSTQVEFLMKRLKDEGFDENEIKYIKFPRYGENFFGRMITEYLHGKFGPADKVNPYLASLIYAGDRWAEKDKLQKWLEDGNIIICDRYADSNLIHQTSKLKDDGEKDKMEKWLDELEYGEYKIPKPDIIFYVDIDIKMSEKFLENKEGKDGHESNGDYLKSCQNEGRRFAKKRGWVLIDSMKDSEMAPKEEIHEKIWKELEGKISR